jgi:glucose/mannose-6-phosphate isomerase
LIPGGRQTRASFGYLLFSILTILQRLNLIPDKTEDIQETIDVVRSVREEIGPPIATADNTAKSLAKKLNGKSVVLYGSQGLTDVAALRWKQQLNENSKMTARYEVFPELNHNEIVSWDAPQLEADKVEVVFLRDGQEHQQIKRRIEATEDFLGTRKVSTTEVWSQGKSFLARLISLSYFSDFVSVYLALLNDIDPTPVKAIAYFKQKLAELQD